MFKKLKLILSIFLFINFFDLSLAKENFFVEAKNKFNERTELGKELALYNILVTKKYNSDN